MYLGVVEHGEETPTGGLCYISHVTLSGKKLLGFHGDPRVFVGKQVSYELTPENFVRNVKVLE